MTHIDVSQGARLTERLSVSRDVTDSTVPSRSTAPMDVLVVRSPFNGTVQHGPLFPMVFGSIERVMGGCLSFLLWGHRSSRTASLGVRPKIASLGGLHKQKASESVGSIIPS